MLNIHIPSCINIEERMLNIHIPSPINIEERMLNIHIPSCMKLARVLSFPAYVCILQSVHFYQQSGKYQRELQTYQLLKH